MKDWGDFPRKKWMHIVGRTPEQKRVFYRRGKNTYALGPMSDPETVLRRYAMVHGLHEDPKHIVRNSPKGHFISQLCRLARGRAKADGLEFSITADDVKNMITAQKAKCALSGVAFSFEQSGNGKRPFAPSIDRINPAIGYVLGNIRIVCQMANIARNSFTDDEFYTMCRAAASNWRRNQTPASGVDLGTSA